MGVPAALTLAKDNRKLHPSAMPGAVFAVYVSVVVNCLVGAAAFLWRPEAFTGAVWPAFAVVAIVVAASVVSFAGFCLRDIGPVRTFLTLIVQTAALILVFAGIYRGYGLGSLAPVLDRETGLYFSIVTWTTLGYGDYRPSDGIRLVAASQALLGYLYLGLIVGVATGLISGRR